MTSVAVAARAAPNANWLDIIRDPGDANLDIVAVHGMNVFGSDDHSESTWIEEESGTHWLKDLLPDILPRARILAYKYNANVVFKKSAAGVEQQARNLLHCLHSKRSAVRPLIFITHSMGGILVKEALATAFHDSQCYSMLWIFTYGIVFFAVPHKGSRHAEWGKITAQIVQLFTGQPNESFLGSVERGSDYNDRLSKRFEPLLNAFKYFSICETVSEHVGIEVGLIVQLDSATLDRDDSQELRIYPNRTHRTVCKFGSSSEPEWQQISTILVRAAASAFNYTAYSPTINEREMTVIHPDVTDAPAGPYSVQQAIYRAHLTVNTAERLFEQLHEEEDLIRNEVREVVFWFWPILIMLGYFIGGVIFSFLPTFLAPRASTIMDKAEHARQSQERLIEFQRQAIMRLDSQRAGVLAAIVELRQLPVHVDLPPNVSAASTEDELSQQVIRILTELEKRSRMIPEEVRRLRRIEDGQREAQGMDNRQVLEMVGRHAQEERDILEARQAAAPSEDAGDGSCPTCIIL